MTLKVEFNIYSFLLLNDRLIIKSSPGYGIVS